MQYSTSTLLTVRIKKGLIDLYKLFTVKYLVA